MTDPQIIKLLRDIHKEISDLKDMLVKKEDQPLWVKAKQIKQVKGWKSGVLHLRAKEYPEHVQRQKGKQPVYNLTFFKNIG